MARGHIRQRSKKNKDSWTVYVYQGVDPVTGKKKYTTEVVRTGKRDAEKRLTELLRLHDTGEYVESAKEKTAEFLGHWFKEYAETHVSPRTLEGYRGNLDRYIIPALGNIRLDKLTGRQIESFESDCQRKGLPCSDCIALSPDHLPGPTVGRSDGDPLAERGRGCRGT